MPLFARFLKDKSLKRLKKVAMEETKIDTKIKKVINSELVTLCKTYHDQIPLTEIFDILKKNNVIAIQEDGTPFEGFLMGNNSSTIFDLTFDGKNVNNSILSLSWYKMESGRFEINAYLS